MARIVTVNSIINVKESIKEIRSKPGKIFELTEDRGEWGQDDCRILINVDHIVSIRD